MARANRRSERKARGRSRRTPVTARSSGGINFPLVPIAVVLGVAAVAGLVIYLVWQSGFEPGNPFGEDAGVEADPAPDLPGEFVDLQTIYGGRYGGGGELDEDANTANHVSRDVDYAADQGLPPAGGPHWGTAGTCASSPAEATLYCGPAQWGIYREPWRPEVLVHNMEHGGVVVWYNTTDQAVIDDLEDLVRDKLEDEMLIVMAPLPDMEEETVGVTSWGRRLVLTAAEYDRDAVDDFIDVFERRFNPENF